MPLVRACAAQDFNASTGVCAHEVWLESPTVLPPLSASEGAELGGAILLLWAIAFTFRSVRQFIWRG